LQEWWGRGKLKSRIEVGKPAKRSANNPWQQTDKEGGTPF